MKQYKYIQGSVNVMADGIARWPRKQVKANLNLLSSLVRRQEASLGEIGWTACSEILQSYSQRWELLRRQTQLMPRLLEYMGEVEARCREDKCIFGCQYRGRVCCGRYIEVVGIYPKPSDLSP